MTVRVRLADRNLEGVRPHLLNLVDDPRVGRAFQTGYEARQGGGWGGGR